MQASVNGWIRVGLLGLPAYGVLTSWSGLDPQPDPGTRLAEWAAYVTTDTYVIKHVFGSSLGLICAVFGTIALGALLTRGRGPALALTAMAVCLLGLTLFLLLMGVSTFAAPMQGHAIVAGVDALAHMPATFADKVMGSLFLAVVALSLGGNLLLGWAIWRSGILPKWAGALWAAAALVMYALGIVYSMIVGVQSTPATVPVGAALIAITGTWIAFAAGPHLRSPPPGG